MKRNFLEAQFSEEKKVALGEYERFVERGTGQGHRDRFYDLKDQPFLGHEAFVDNVHGSLNEQSQFVYDIPLAEVVSEVSSASDISTHLLYSPNRNHQGALGRAVWDTWEGNWVVIRLGGL